MAFGRTSYWIVALGAACVLTVIALSDRETTDPVDVGFTASGVSDATAASDAGRVEVDAATIPVEEARAFSADERVFETRSREPSGIESFVELRGVPRVAAVRSDLEKFASEPRDPAWATALEARLQSALAQMTATLTGSYVECRTSRCVVALIRPAGAYDQTVQVGPPNGALTRDVGEVGRSLDLLGVGASQLVTRDGALVHWQTLHRRCGPDWKCLE